MNIDSTEIKDILELVRFQQPDNTRIAIIRGSDFYARYVDEELQESICGYCETPIKEFKKAITFEKKLGSKQL